MNKVITFVSIFTVIFFLMLTVVLGLVIHFMGDPKQPVFWLFTTLFIGMFLSFIISVGNISSMVKINKLKIDKKLNKDHSFTTCPNYWLKHIVKKPHSEDVVVMCYNILPDKDDLKNADKLTFIDGYFDGTFTDPTDLSSVNLNINSSTTHPVLTSNLTELRHMASYSNIEAFSELGNQYDYTDGNDYNQNFHYHNNVHIMVGPEISGNSNLTDHQHNTYSNVGRRGHSHTLGWDMNSQRDVYFETYNPAFSNFDYWINPREIKMSDGTTKFAIELNLEKLNLANNSCELARLFNWNEFNSKCVL